MYFSFSKQYILNNLIKVCVLVEGDPRKNIKSLRLAQSLKKFGYNIELVGVKLGSADSVIEGHPFVIRVLTISADRSQNDFEEDVAKCVEHYLQISEPDVLHTFGNFGQSVGGTLKKIYSQTIWIHDCDFEACARHNDPQFVPDGIIGGNTIPASSNSKLFEKSSFQAIWPYARKSDLDIFYSKDIRKTLSEKASHLIVTNTRGVNNSNIELAIKAISAIESVVLAFESRETDDLNEFILATSRYFGVEDKVQIFENDSFYRAASLYRTATA